MAELIAGESRMVSLSRSLFNDKCAEIEELKAGLLEGTSLLDHPELERIRHEGINITNDAFLMKLWFAVKTLNEDMQDASKRNKELEKTIRRQNTKQEELAELKDKLASKTRQSRRSSPASSQESERSSLVRTRELELKSQPAETGKRDVLEGIWKGVERC
jgi:hypothetical protein